jgi:O-antigen ligase
VEQQRRIDLAAFATAALAIVLIASDQGGYFERTWAWAGLGLAAAGALALRSFRDLRVGIASIALIAATAAISGWTALSWFWSAEPSATADEALRTPIYLAAAVTFVVLAAAGGSLGILLGVSAGTTAIAAYSLVHRLFTPAHGQLLAEPLGYANALGALCAIGIVVTATLGVTRRWPLAIVPIAVLTTALSLTASRGSWLALATGALVAAAAWRGWAGRAMLAVGAGLTALYVSTVFTTLPGDLQARGDYWHVAWHVGFQHPLRGLGAGTYDLAWAAYGNLDRWGNALDAHSLYLETFAELGLVGVVLVAALAWPLVAAAREQVSATTAAAIGGALAYLVHAGFDWDWEMPAVTTAGIACLAAACPRGKSCVNPLQSTLWVMEGGLIVAYGLRILL